jgi:hypothetical protein
VRLDVNEDDLAAGRPLWDGPEETVAKRAPFASWTSRACLGSLLLSLGAACGTTTITGSGNLVTKPVPVSSFSKIQIADAFDVSVTLGHPVHVTVRVDGNLLNHSTRASRVAPCIWG